MRKLLSTLSTLTLSLGLSVVSHADPIDAIEPSAEATQTGLAGQDPADIARYILARGAGPARLSPDGKMIAFSYGITGKTQVWTIPLMGGQPQQMTFGNGITFFAWSPEGQELVYGADNNGNEQESYYALNIAAGTERELLPAIKGGFRSFGGFNAKGDKIAYASTERNGLDFDIYLADTSSGESSRVYKGKYGNFVQAVSPDASRLVISETVGEDSDNIYVLDTKTKKRTVLSKANDPLKDRANHTDGGMAWSADGQALYFATNKDREYTALMGLKLENGEMETLYEAQADVENVQLCARDKYLVFTTNHDGFDRLHMMNMETGKNYAASDLPDGVYRLSCTDKSDTLLVGVNGFDRPGDLYTIGLDNGQMRKIFASNYAGLNKAKLVRPESVRMMARDDVELQGLLYMPDEVSRGTEKPPVVFVVHGGPTAQARPTYNANIQYLVDQGIAVFATNVRGSTGFGRSYVMLDDREKRLDSVRDLIDMLGGLKKDGRVDVDRAAVLGGSYGGYVVNAVLAEYPESFKAGVSLFGVADWITALEVASPALKASDLIEYGNIEEKKWRDFYTQYSPIRQADKIKVPVLFSHGVMDPRIDIAETETMVKALRANGIEALFIRIPDEGHGWRKLSNQLFYNRRQAEFLLEHLEVK